VLLIGFVASSWIFIKIFVDFFSIIHNTFILIWQKKTYGEFALKFELVSVAFTKLVFQKIENQVKYLKSQLLPIQNNYLTKNGYSHE